MGTAIEPIKEQERQFFQMAAKEIGVKYGIDLMVERVRSQIHTANDKQVVTVADVAQVVTEAMAKHLDPLKGGLYAFKDKNNSLVIGTTKRGFQQALSSQPTFRDCKFIPHGELKSKVVVTKQGRKTITYYDYVTCVIKKHFPDGTDAYVEGNAYFDEEFNEINAAWVKSPKRLLDGRALCIASANAYGWGAYDVEEAGRAMGFNVGVEPETGSVFTVDAVVEEETAKPVPVTSGAERAKQALAKTTEPTKEVMSEVLAESKADLVKKIQACNNRKELEDAYLKAPEALKKDPEILSLFTAVASGL